jgi:hypothetical protein
MKMIGYDLAETSIAIEFRAGSSIEDAVFTALWQAIDRECTVRFSFNDIPFEIDPPIEFKGDVGEWRVVHTKRLVAAYHTELARRRRPLR